MIANRTLPSFWTLGTASAGAEEAQTFVEDRMVHEPMAGETLQRRAVQMAELRRRA